MRPRHLGLSMEIVSAAARTSYAVIAPRSHPRDHVGCTFTQLPEESVGNLFPQMPLLSFVGRSNLSLNLVTYVWMQVTIEAIDKGFPHLVRLGLRHERQEERIRF